MILQSIGESFIAPKCFCQTAAFHTSASIVPTNSHSKISKPTKKRGRLWARNPHRRRSAIFQKILETRNGLRRLTSSQLLVARWFFKVKPERPIVSRRSFDK